MVTGGNGSAVINEPKFCQRNKCTITEKSQRYIQFLNRVNFEVKFWVHVDLFGVS